MYYRHFNPPPQFVSHKVMLEEDVAPQKENKFITAVLLPWKSSNDLLSQVCVYHLDLYGLYNSIYSILFHIHKILQYEGGKTVQKKTAACI